MPLLHYLKLLFINNLSVNKNKYIPVYLIAYFYILKKVKTSAFAGIKIFVEYVVEFAYLTIFNLFPELIAHFDHGFGIFSAEGVLD